MVFPLCPFLLSKCNCDAANGCSNCRSFHDPAGNLIPKAPFCSKMETQILIYASVHVEQHKRNHTTVHKIKI